MTRLNLVVAEADTAMRHWLYVVLSRMGASIRVASSGWELLALLGDDPEGVDLVISDVWMPMPGGVNVLAMARTAGVIAPFVLITGFADDRMRSTAHDLRAFVLDKPFLATELESRVRDLVPGACIHRRP